MWQNNNGFGNGQYTNGFNGEPFPQSPFAGSPDAFPGLQYFPTQQNLMQFEGVEDDSFMGNGFQPEVGLYNNDVAFMQNQFITPQVCFVELTYLVSSCAITIIVARAASKTCNAEAPG